VAGSAYCKRQEPRGKRQSQAKTRALILAAELKTRVPREKNPALI